MNPIYVSNLAVPHMHIFGEATYEHTHTHIQVQCTGLACARANRTVYLYSLFALNHIARARSRTSLSYVRCASLLHFARARSHRKVIKEWWKKKNLAEKHNINTYFSEPNRRQTNPTTTATTKLSTSFPTSTHKKKPSTHILETNNI